VIAKPVSQVSDFSICQAIEKEVCGNQIVVRSRGTECPSVRDVDADAMRRCAARELAQHGLAGVDGVDHDGRIRMEQARREAAISIAEDETIATLAQPGEKCAAATLEERTEGEPLHPAVDAGDIVEIRRRGSCCIFVQFDFGGEICHPCSTPGISRRAGTSRTRSASARSVTGARR